MNPTAKNVFGRCSSLLKHFLLQEDLLLCRGRACACLLFGKWNCLPSQHGRGKNFIYLKISFFINLLYRAIVFSLCLVISLFIVLFFFLEWRYRLNSEYKIKPNQTLGYHTLEGENLCHAEVTQYHSFNLNAISFLPGRFTICKAKFSRCRSQHECSILVLEK